MKDVGKLFSPTKGYNITNRDKHIIITYIPSAHCRRHDPKYGPCHPNFEQSHWLQDKIHQVDVLSQHKLLQLQYPAMNISANYKVYSRSKFQKGDKGDSDRQFLFLERFLITKQWPSNNTGKHRRREVLSGKATLHILQSKVSN